MVGLNDICLANAFIVQPTFTLAQSITVHNDVVLTLDIGRVRPGCTLFLHRN